MAAAPPTNENVCPSCDLPLKSGAVVCPSCGVVLPIERAQKFGKEVLKSLLIGLSASPALRIKAAAWLMALMPFLIIPPIIVLGLTFLRRGRIVTANNAAIDLTWPAVFAFANLLVSVALLIKVNKDGGTLLQHVLHIWRSFLLPNLSGSWV
jgi:hypothetical protein